MNLYRMELLSLLAAMMLSCETYVTPDPTAHKNDSISTSLYVEQYDKFSDKGQYNLPKQKLGNSFWVVVNSTSNVNDYSDNSLRTSLLAESIIGLTALAVNENRGSTMVWSDVATPEYIALRNNTGMKNLGSASVWELLEKPEIKQCIKGYVLYNMLRQESISAATVAAHVYESILVDAQNEAKVQALGYTKTYDASNQTPVTAWAAFRDKCNNNALLFMPTLTANNKGFAIAHRLMFINFNKRYAFPSSGNNSALFSEVLAWLKPLSPVIGWEQNVDEHSFVNLVSNSGNIVAPADWLYNLTILSANYTDKQQGIATVTNPRYITYSDTASFASFFLSDGDNIQWMINGFRNSKYYFNPDNIKTKISFGMPVSNLSTMIPGLLPTLFAEQSPSNSIIEFGGNGYFYADDFASGVKGERTTLLANHAQKIADNLRQRRIKLLGLFCNDVKSEEAKEAYQAYISKNDQLVGIIALQYTPYAGGNGEIMWFKNANNIHIPVVTVRYSMWNFGNSNNSNEGTPAFVASQINKLSDASKSTFSMVAVHAWSAFSDIGESTSLTDENKNGTAYSATPVSWCTKRLNKKVRVVNAEEFMWQLRMKTFPEETRQILQSFY
ncbi:MAG: GxGYxYP family putative glycoside hydrolase [Paludibacter sp.]|nr:GxGYxYP family putative glycoside hydrolase [Paludibacter sp.]